MQANLWPGHHPETQVTANHREQALSPECVERGSQRAWVAMCGNTPRAWELSPLCTPPLRIPHLPNREELAKDVRHGR